MRDEQAKAIIWSYAAMKSIGVALTPMPVADVLGGSAVDVTMVVTLAHVYGISLTWTNARQLIESILKAAGWVMLGEMATHLAASLFKGLTFGSGTVLTALPQGAAAGYGSFIVGQAAKYYFEHGASLGRRSAQDRGDPHPAGHRQEIGARATESRNQQENPQQPPRQKRTVARALRERFRPRRLEAKEDCHRGHRDDKLPIFVHFFLGALGALSGNMFHSSFFVPSPRPLAPFFLLKSATCFPTIRLSQIGPGAADAKDGKQALVLKSASSRERAQQQVASPRQFSASPRTKEIHRSADLHAPRVRECLAFVSGRSRAAIAGIPVRWAAYVRDLVPATTA